MSRRPKSPPESVSALLPRVLEELGMGETSAASRLLRVWNAALGPDLAPHCRAEGLARGVVRARVRDSAWMQRIQFEKPAILARLRAELDDDPAAPTDLRLRIGPIDS